MTIRSIADESTVDAVAWFGGLFDDAALFPPGNAPMLDAVQGHLAWRASEQSTYVGAFVCSDTRWTELTAHLPDTARIRVSLTVPGGAESVEDAVAAVQATTQATLSAVEVPLLPGQDLADATRILDEALPTGVTGYLEIPVSDAGHHQCRALGFTRHHLKLRTGGTTAATFPSEAELAAAIRHAVSHRLPFKLTAGLHHAVRHRDAETGFEHHGFLNVLLATSAALAGGPISTLASFLEVRNPTTIASALRRLAPGTAASTRRVFESFGTCSIDEPLTDLTDLGLIERTSP